MNGLSYVETIRKSYLTIYDPIEIGHPALWIPSRELEEILNKSLHGMDVNYSNRTRSKVVKSAICKALGYPVPSRFKKTQPRFPGQNFDVFVQKSNNLQIWNEEVMPSRRYVIIDVNENKLIERVKVVTGDDLADLDNTGTLTTKYQARLIPGEVDYELVSPVDTPNILSLLGNPAQINLTQIAPTLYPKAAEILPIKEIFHRLSPLVGTSFVDPGLDQERNRGSGLHRLICKALGFSSYQDDGRFPDIKNQLIEVKLQTSPTIDLGVALPSSIEPLDIPMIQGIQIRHCDVRYAMFYGSTNGLQVTLTHLFVTTGEGFFSRFTQFGGNIRNQKIQIRLPSNFFD